MFLLFLPFFGGQDPPPPNFQRFSPLPFYMGGWGLRALLTGTYAIRPQAVHRFVGSAFLKPKGPPPPGRGKEGPAQQLAGSPVSIWGFRKGAIRRVQPAAFSRRRKLESPPVGGGGLVELQIRLPPRGGGH